MAESRPFLAFFAGANQPPQVARIGQAPRPVVEEQDDPEPRALAA